MYYGNVSVMSYLGVNKSILFTEKCFFFPNKCCFKHSTCVWAMNLKWLQNHEHMWCLCGWGHYNLHFHMSLLDVHSGQLLLLQVRVPSRATFCYIWVKGAFCWMKVGSSAQIQPLQFQGHGAAFQEATEAVSVVWGRVASSPPCSCRGRRLRFAVTSK